MYLLTIIKHLCLNQNQLKLCCFLSPDKRGELTEGQIFELW